MTDSGEFKSRPNQTTDIREPWWRSTSRLARPSVAWVLAFGSVALGGVIAVWPIEIRDATRAFLAGPRHGLNWWVLLFWIAVLAWAWVLYRRLKSDHQTEDSRIAELLRAIHRVPNYRVIQTYPDFYNQIAEAVERTAAAAPDDKLASLEAGLIAVLTLVAGLAAEFARASDDTVYGANIMLVAKSQAGKGDSYDQELLKSMIFYDKDGGNPTSLKAILYLPGTLLLSTVDEAITRKVPLISLPVPHEPKTRLGHRLALPGAPWALLTGTQSLVEDTREMAGTCEDFARPIVDEIKRYFSDEGEGSEVRSFVSYRIGDEKVPVGVLNIDSNHTDVLGREPEYYATFLALISPVLRLLRKPVMEYAKLSTAKGLYLHRAATSANGSTPAVASTPRGA